MVGPAMVMVDGKIAVLRGRDSRPTTKYIKLNNKDLVVTDPDERQFDPPKVLLEEHWRDLLVTWK